MFANIKDAVIDRFLERAARGLGIERADELALLENPTEELVDAHQRGKAVKLFARIPGRAVNIRQQLAARPPKKAGRARLEETYLYSTRRWPGAADNVIGAGALTVGTFPFFTAKMGDAGNSAGFPQAMALTLNETNMEIGSQVPSGQRFVFNQLGISANAGAVQGDLDQLLEAANLQFSMAGGTFQLNQGPLKFWPGGTGNAHQNASNNGTTDIRAVRNLRIARNIGPGEVFQYAFQIPRATKSTDGAAIALTAFTNTTVWLYGGWKTAVRG